MDNADIRERRAAELELLTQVPSRDWILSLLSLENMRLIVRALQGDSNKSLEYRLSIIKKMVKKHQGSRLRNAQTRTEETGERDDSI